MGQAGRQLLADAAVASTRGEEVPDHENTARGRRGSAGLGEGLDGARDDARHAGSAAPVIHRSSMRR